MQHLEGSGTPVLYIGPRFLKVNRLRCFGSRTRYHPPMQTSVVSPLEITTLTPITKIFFNIRDPPDRFAHDDRSRVGFRNVILR